MRAVMVRAFAALAVLGLAAWLSLFVALLLQAFADFGLPEDQWAWVWISIAWLGLIAAVAFGGMALIVSRPAGTVGPWVRGGLGLLVLASVLMLALVAGGRLMVVLGVLAIPGVLYFSRWRGKPRTGHDH